MQDLMRNPNLSSELGYNTKKSRKTQRSLGKQVKNIAKFSLISKCYFPLYENMFDFSAGSRFFSYSQHVKGPIKTGFEGAPKIIFW